MIDVPLRRTVANTPVDRDRDTLLSLLAADSDTLFEMQGNLRTLDPLH